MSTFIQDAWALSYTEEPFVAPTTDRLAYLTGYSRRVVARDLRALVTEGVVTMNGGLCYFDLSKGARKPLL